MSMELEYIFLYNCVFFCILFCVIYRFIYVINMNDTSNNFDCQMRRVFAVTGARTQVELAALLGLKQSTIANSKKRRNVPDRWLIQLLCRFNVNPAWVLTGKGQRYLIAAKDSQGREAMEIVRNLPTRVIVEELLRRIHTLERDSQMLRRLGMAVHSAPSDHE